MALADPPVAALEAAVPTAEIDGQAYPLIDSAIERMRMCEGLGGLSTLELGITDWIRQADGSSNFGAVGQSPLVLGAGIRVYAGPPAIQASEIFDGQITAIEAETREDGAPLFTVLAEDRLFAARRKRRSRFFEAKSPKQIAEQIANDYGLTPEVRDGLDQPTADWEQAGETDLAFLRRVLDRFDADVQIVAARMQVGRTSASQRASVTLNAGNELRRLRVTADIADQVTALSVSGYDPAAGDTVTGTATPGGSGPGQGRTGADVLNDKFTAVAERLGRLDPMSQAEADAAAQAAFDRRARAFVRATGTARGDAQIRVGTWLTLAGINPQFANVYAVREATHRWDRDTGYLTDFVAECAWLGGSA